MQGKTAFSYGKFSPKEHFPRKYSKTIWDKVLDTFNTVIKVGDEVGTKNKWCPLKQELFMFDQRQREPE